jgi:hypothetical protein
MNEVAACRFAGRAQKSLRGDERDGISCFHQRMVSVSVVMAPELYDLMVVK